MLEIGVMGGGSLAMWREYFGEGAKIVGLDINPDCKRHAAKDVDIFIGSQSDKAVLDEIKQKYPQLDIVLDDGSHISADMIASFNRLYGHVQAHGVYMVEDTHANYWPDWGGGVNVSGTFMEFAKDRLDDINAAHTRGALPISDFTASTDYIAVYDSIVAFEKRPQGRRQAPITIGMALPEQDMHRA